MEGLALIVPRRHAGATRDQRRAIVPDLPFALDAKDSSKATMLHESPGWSGLGKLARGRALGQRAGAQHAVQTNCYRRHHTPEQRHQVANWVAGAVTAAPEPWG
jgi:hypothetical protein